MSVLSKDSIHKEMTFEDDPLVITPLLEESQISGASVDVRLGHEFIVLKESSVSSVDPSEVKQWTTILGKSQEKVRVPRHCPFVLHPNQLVLAGTLEYISVPKRLAASVEGRSSWGRLGLIVATANLISPGFKGCITLEIVNDGGVPLIVYPGMKIAQIIFSRVEGIGKYEGRYDCPTGPQMTRIHLDDDAKLWGPTGNASPEKS